MFPAASSARLQQAIGSKSGFNNLRPRWIECIVFSYQIVIRVSGLMNAVWWHLRSIYHSLWRRSMDWWSASLLGKVRRAYTDTRKSRLHQLMRNPVFHRRITPLIETTRDVNMKTEFKQKFRRVNTLLYFCFRGYLFSFIRLVLDERSFHKVPVGNFS